MLLFPCLIQAQSTHVQQPRRHSPHSSYWEPRKLVLGLVFSPAISGPSASLNTLLVGNDPRHREEAKIAFSLGLQARYKINDRWEAQIRALRTDKGYKQILVGPVTISDKAPQTSRLYFLSLPASIRYNLKKGTVTVYMYAGLAPEKFLRAAGLRHEDQFHPFSLSYLAGLGGEFPLKDEWFVNIEPVFMHSLTAVNQYRGYKPLSVGLIVGFFYEYRPEQFGSGR